MSNGITERIFYLMYAKINVIKYSADIFDPLGLLASVY